MENDENTKQVSNYFFVGFIMLGLAAGFFYGNIVVGSLGGLGMGFIFKAIYMHNKKGE